MNISLEVVSEIPRVIEAYKDVYCKEIVAEYTARKEEERQREDVV